jgi:hypothetical protein
MHASDHSEDDGNLATGQSGNWGRPLSAMVTWRRRIRQSGKPWTFPIAESLVEEIERDLESDVERRELLRAQAANIVRQSALR